MADNSSMQLLVQQSGSVLRTLKTGKTRQTEQSWCSRVLSRMLYGQPAYIPEGMPADQMKEPCR